MVSCPPNQANCQVLSSGQKTKQEPRRHNETTGFLLCVRCVVVVHFLEAGVKTDFAVLLPAE